MTNLLAQIVIVFILSTNWTGHINGTNELGYITTNYVAKITYEEQKYEFQLKSVPSNVIVWRPQSNNYVITNNWHIYMPSYPTEILTNIIIN